MNTEFYVIDPENIKDTWAYEELERILGHFWTHNEFNYSTLRAAYMKMPEKHQHMLKVVLTFFVYSDGKVNEGLEYKVIPLCDHIEQQQLYVQQTYFEVIHARTYSLLANALFPSIEERREVMNGNYAREVIDSIEDFVNSVYSMASLEKRLATFFGFACIENLFFSPMFAVIYFFKYHYTSGDFDIEALTASNEFIARDESEHVNTHSHMFRFYSRIDKFNLKEIHDILFRALETAYRLCDKLMERIGPDENFNGDKLKRYIRLQANNMLSNIGLEPIVEDAENPFTWMDNMGMHVKTNNFEALTTSYRTGIENIEMNFDVNDFSLI